MKLLFKDSFAKDLKGIKDRALLSRIEWAIESGANASDLREVPGIRRLRETGNYYRIRVGDYRIGLIADKDEPCPYRKTTRKGNPLWLPMNWVAERF